MFFHGSIILFFYNKSLITFTNKSTGQIIAFRLSAIAIDGNTYTICGTSTHKQE